MRLFVKVLFLFLFFICCLFITGKTFAETTEFRSANNITTSGTPSFTNLSNCSATDGTTCDRSLANLYANLYFRNFGDFGIPDGSTVTGVRLRVTGKANAGLYVGVSQGSVYGYNCQFPSWLWQMWILNGSTIKTYAASGTVSSSSLWCLTTLNIKNNNLTWKINYSSGSNWSANIDNFEIAYDYTPPLTPTPTPTVAPFLDLPWDYESQGKSFSEQALNPQSWFDHQYPLQNIPCCIEEVLVYKGRLKNDFYRSHSGYDYALKNGVMLDTPVLAAASGWATFKPLQESGGAGNIIKIDHENGYQTWYEHLNSAGLVISTTGQKIFVNKGQVIGRVGMTGNTSGPHIHFSVFKDENGNGNFDDDYPYGFVDPLGWEGENIDPWTEWESNGRKGATSYNLFIKRSQPTQKSIPVSGETLSSGKINISVPNNSYSSVFNILLSTGPFESASLVLKSISPSFFLNAFDESNKAITQFLKPINIDYDYSGVDLSNVNEDSLKLYFYNIQTNQWEPLPTTIDKFNKIIQSETIHFTQFAVMGELKDLIPPITDVKINGDKGDNNWYKSDAKVVLTGIDNENGLGLQYALYSLNNNDWHKYNEPISFADEGNYEIYYQSIDKADNREERKSLKLDIDKTPPIISSTTKVNGNTYVPNTWVNNDVIVTFICADLLSGVSWFTDPVTITTEGENQKATGECKDKAGNFASIEISGINIDKSIPEAEIKYNPTTLDLEITGIDISPTTITTLTLPKHEHNTTITDSTGNSLKILIKKSEEGDEEAEIIMKSLQYNEEELINLNSSKLSIESEDKKIEQEFEIKKELKLKLLYNVKKNKTQVVKKIKGDEKITEELEGIRILKLVTEQGKLNYNY